MGNTPKNLPLTSQVDPRQVYAYLYGQAPIDPNAATINPAMTVNAAPALGAPSQPGVIAAAMNGSQVPAQQSQPTPPGTIAAAMNGAQPPAQQAQAAPAPTVPGNTTDDNLYQGKKLVASGGVSTPPATIAAAMQQGKDNAPKPPALGPEPTLQMPQGSAMSGTGTNLQPTPTNPQWDYLNNMYGPGGNAPTPGPPPAPIPLSRGQKIARDIALAMTTAMNPAAGAIGIEQALNTQRAYQQRLQEYQRNQPAEQEKANQAAYAANAQAQEELARAGEAQAGTAVQQQEAKRIPFEMGREQEAAKANALQQIMDEKGSGKYSEQQLQTRWEQMATANPHLGLTLQDIQGAISGAPRTVPAAAPIRGLDGFIAGVQLPNGQQIYGADIAKASPEVQQMYTNEKRTEGIAIQRQINMAQVHASIEAGQQARLFMQQDKMMEARQTMERQKELSAFYDKALNANERLSQMEESNLHPNAQNDVSMLMNHIGMTLGAQKGARITQDMIKEAEQARGLPDGFLVNLVQKTQNGEMLSPLQRLQMLQMGEAARNLAWQAARQKAELWGLSAPPGAPALEAEPVLPSDQVLATGKGAPPLPAASAAPATHVFSQSAWQRANPGGNVQQAIAAAKAQNYQVGP